ncbi:hypothetical protein D1007_33691 [Hordeum vulgare]|nr:hypothetical protein D1007_33691 [Hordeum vulgare]KAI4994536.1 hypothetical protein ZWY2020_034177 [Hordeum vulgare]
MTSDAKSLYDDGSKNAAYHDNIRELQGRFREYGPLMSRVSSELNEIIFDGSNALSSALGSRDTEKKLRGTVKNFVNKCRKLVGLLGCASTADAYAPAAPMRSLASSSHVASCLGWLRRMRRKVKMKKKTRSERKKNKRKKRNKATRRRSTMMMTDLHQLRQPSLRRRMCQRGIG